MKYENLLITPEDLLDPDNPVKFTRNRSLLEVACISFDIQLRPLELLVVIRLIGAKNVELRSSRYTDLCELYDHVGEQHRVKNPSISANVDTFLSEEAVKGGSATSLPFGLKEYDCRLFFRGEGLLRLLGLSTANICYRKPQDDNGKLESKKDSTNDDDIIIDADAMIYGNFMSSVYQELYNMLAKDRNRVFDNSVYGGVKLNYIESRFKDGILNPPTIATSLRYIISPTAIIDIANPDKSLTMELIKELSELPNEKVVKEAVHVKTIFIVAIPVAYLPLVFLFRPEWATILEYDSLVIDSTITDGNTLLGEAYTNMRETAEINMVVRVDIKEAINWTAPHNTAVKYPTSLYNKLVDHCVVINEAWHIV